MAVLATYDFNKYVWFSAVKYLNKDKYVLIIHTCIKQKYCVKERNASV